MFAVMNSIADIAERPGQWHVVADDVRIRKGMTVAAYAGTKGAATIARGGIGYIIDCVVDGAASMSREVRITDAIETACERLGITCPRLDRLPERMR